MKEEGIVRYGVVGLGWFAQSAVLPAFDNALRNSELAALISTDDDKLEELGEEYDVDVRFPTDELERAIDEGELDALYVAVPNHVHREIVERAADAGVHVLCEKPMAVTAEDCRAMIDATEDAGVKLMIAYRLHFEEANMKAVEIVSSGRIGEPLFFTSAFATPVEDEDNIRLGPYDKGGGTLYDIGIYCINAARYLFREEPCEVTAVAVEGSGRFAACDEMTAAVLRFPDGKLASFTSSFRAADQDYYQVFGTEGDLLVRPAFSFHGCLGHALREGSTDSLQMQHFPVRDQVAPELLHFSDAILENRDPEPSGREGLIDVQIIEALLESADTGEPVELDLSEPYQRPDLSQEEHKETRETPSLVHTEGPS